MYNYTGKWVPYVFQTLETAQAEKHVSIKQPTAIYEERKAGWFGIPS